MRRSKSYKQNPGPNGWDMDDEYNDKAINEAKSDQMPKLIGMFDEYSNKYYFFMVSFTVFTSSILLFGIGLGIFYLISNGMRKYKTIITINRSREMTKLVFEMILYNLKLCFIVCSNSSRCREDRFCNFENGETGFCLSCPEADQICTNQTFLSERGIQECQDICEGKII